MAFTAAERIKIRHYMGYPQTFKYANTRLESAMDQAGADPDMTAHVQALLEKLDEIWDTFSGKGLITAGLRTLDKDDAGFFPGAANSVAGGIASIGRTYANQLSITFGVNLANDVFGTVGYQSDTWMLNNGRVSIAGLG